MKSGLSVLFFLIFISCAKKNITAKNTPAEKQEKDYKTLGYTKATVKDFTGLAGCKYLLQLDDSTRLEPLNLDPSFTIPELKLWVKFTIKNDAISICMSGKPAILNDVKKRGHDE